MSKFEAVKQMGRTLQGLLTRFVLQRGRKPNNLEMILLKREAAQTGIEERKIISMVDRQPVNPNEPIMGGQNLKKEFISETDDEIIARLKKGNEDSLNRLKNKKDKPDDMATGGRAGYYGGGQAMVGEDLSEIGHGSDSLMARNMQLAPNSMATTSTGLNYLLGQDNDTARVPYSDGLNFKKFYGKKLDKAMEKMLEEETEVDKDLLEEGKKELDKKALDKYTSIFETKPTRDKFLPGKQGDKEYKLALNKYYETEKGKKEQENEMFKMVEEFQTLKKKGMLRPNETFQNFQKMKEQSLLKNKILELDIKYPEKEIINKETGALNKENLKKAIDQAQVDLEISPIDGLKLKRSLNTEGEQSVTGGEYTTGNLNFSSDNIEEGKLTSKGNFNFGGIDLSGMVNSNDGEILNTELGFNYDNALKGKMQNSDGYRKTEFDLTKNFTLPSKFTEASATSDGYDMMPPKIKNKKLKNVLNNFDFGIKGNYDITEFDGKTYKSSDLTPKLSYNDGILSADISKEILEGGDELNLGAGVNYNNFYAKGDNLLSKDRNALLGYQKEFGDKDGDLFFTAGAEKNLSNDEFTGGVGLKYKYADGGRIGYNKGKAVKAVVDEGRRGFMKAAGATTAGIAALKTGLLGFGEKVAPVAKEAVEVVSNTASQVPAYFLNLVQKIKNLGDDAQRLSTKDREKVTTYKDYTLTEDVTTGEQTVQRMKVLDDDSASYYGQPLTEETYMSYKPGKGLADETTKGKTIPDEYDEGTALLRSDRGNAGEIVEESATISDDVIEEGTKFEDNLSDFGKADGGRIGFNKGKFVEKLIKAGQGKFTKAQYLIERIKNTIKGSPDDKYVQETFPGFIKELEVNPELAKNENVFKELGGDLPEGQQIVVYGDDTLDFFTTSSGPQNIKKLENFMAKHDLPKDQALRIMKMEPNDQVMELTKTKFIKQKRTDNSSGGLAAMLGE